MAVLMDFRADWCGPCNQQDDILDEVEEELGDLDNFKVRTIDIDERREVADEYEVRSIPTLFLKESSSDGPEDSVERYVGVTSKDELLNDIRSLLD